MIGRKKRVVVGRISGVPLYIYFFHISNLKNLEMNKVHKKDYSHHVRLKNDAIFSMHTFHMSLIEKLKFLVPSTYLVICLLSGVYKL